MRCYTENAKVKRFISPGKVAPGQKRVTEHGQTRWYNQRIWPSPTHIAVLFYWPCSLRVPTTKRSSSTGSEAKSGDHFVRMLQNFADTRSTYSATTNSHTATSIHEAPADVSALATTVVSAGAVTGVKDQG